MLLLQSKGGEEKKIFKKHDHVCVILIKVYHDCCFNTFAFTWVCLHACVRASGLRVCECRQGPAKCPHIWSVAHEKEILCSSTCTKPCMTSLYSALPSVRQYNTRQQRRCAANDRGTPNKFDRMRKRNAMHTIALCIRHTLAETVGVWQYRVNLFPLLFFAWQWLQICIGERQGAPTVQVYPLYVYVTYTITSSFYTWLRWKTHEDGYAPPINDLVLWLKLQYVMRGKLWKGVSYE